MLGVIETLLQLARDVAGHASIGVFLRRPMETEDQFIRERCFRIVAVSCLLRISMRLSRSVTRFTG